MLHKLEKPRGSTKTGKRKGRGPGSNLGKTGGRGQKGQYARSKVRRGFEGGQMPLHRRLPRRGFKNPFRTVYAIINLGDLDKRKGLQGIDEIDPQVLLDKGVIRRKYLKIKVLGDGEVSRPLKITAHRFSRSAVEKLKAAGGEAVVIEG